MAHSTARSLAQAKNLTTAAGIRVAKGKTCIWLRARSERAPGSSGQQIQKSCGTPSHDLARVSNDHGLQQTIPPPTHTAKPSMRGAAYADRVLVLTSQIQDLQSHLLHFLLRKLIYCSPLNGSHQPLPAASRGQALHSLTNPLRAHTAAEYCDPIPSSCLKLLSSSPLLKREGPKSLSWSLRPFTLPSPHSLSQALHPHHSTCCPGGTLIPNPSSSSSLQPAP